MKKLVFVAGIGALVLGANGSAFAQVSSGSGIPITKDRPEAASTTTTTSNGEIAWNGPLGYSLRPGAAPVYCAASDAAEVAKVSIKSDLYVPATMISPDQAKAIALCAVPGQISSGEMQSGNGVTSYEIAILPTGKQTYSKVEINAANGDIINAKQFGGLRGLAGYLRESAERKNNKTAP
jgi:uncharacterized membrane protein YkoI